MPTIHVTAADVARGKRPLPGATQPRWAAAVEFALGRVVAEDVVVTVCSVTIDLWRGRDHGHVRNPPELLAWLDAHDAGGDPGPLTFDVELPDLDKPKPAPKPEPVKPAVEAPKPKPKRATKPATKPAAATKPAPKPKPKAGSLFAMDRSYS